MNGESPLKHVGDDNPVRLLPEKAPQSATPPVPQVPAGAQIRYPTNNTQGVFSTDYDIPDQFKFRIALEERDFTRALEVMRAIPRGATDLDRVQYLVTMREGLEALTEGFMPEMQEKIDTLQGELDSYKVLGNPAEFLKLLQDYKALGGETPDGLKALVEEREKKLRDFEGIGTREELIERLAKLRKYEEIYADPEHLKKLTKAYENLGTVEDIKKEQAELGELRETARILRSS